MRRGLLVGVVVLAVGTAALPVPRDRSIDLVSSVVPWVGDYGADARAAVPDPASTSTDVAGSINVEASTAQVDGARQPTPTPTTAPDEHRDGPPADLEISDDLPIPPLAPGAGGAQSGVARPATPNGPHWVPFKGNRILWCVYRGAGRCDGHHSYPAIDVDMKPGTPIYAAGPGTVYQSCNRGSACGGYGNHVRIQHPNNVRSIYGHFTKAVVRRGQTVRTGTLIGYSGCTGRCNGAHLHYEERNTADQSIQIGQMQGYAGARVVTYPNVWGHRSWTGIPPDRLRIRNDFYPEDDRDDDGTLDRHEACLTRPGPTANKGCPWPRRAPESGDVASADGHANLRFHSVTNDGAVWQLTRFARGWSWTDLGVPGAGVAAGGVASTRAGGGLTWTLAVDRAGSLWSGRAPQGTWQWTEVGRRGGGFTGTPAVAAGADGSVVVHVVDSTGALWRAVLRPGATWAWTDLGARGGGFSGSTPTSYFTGQNDTVTAVADRSGGLHVYTLKADGRFWVNDVTTPGGATAARPALIVDKVGLPSVFVATRNGRLWRYLRSYAGSWVWIDHGPLPGGDGGRGLTAWRTTADNIVVAGVDRSGQIRATTQTGVLTFTWRNLGSVGPLAGLGSIASGVTADGVGQVFVSSAGEVQRIEARGSWPRRTHPTAGPAVR